jgi:Flp pilus assembly protein TadG
MKMNPGPEIAPQALGRRGRRVLRCIAALTRSERGESLVEFALMLPFLGLLLLGVIDFGRAYYLSIEVTSAAHTGALYGVRNPSDTTGMQSAAIGDAADISSITATATYGCECSDGSNAVAPCSVRPSCSTNVVNYVQVNTSATYKPMFPWPGIPGTMTLRGMARLRAGQ